VTELIFGCARQAGQGPNPARQVALASGLPETTIAYTVNMACGSGLKAIALGADAIRLGRAQAVVAGGVELMSRVPFMLDRMRTGYRLGHGKLIDGMYQDGFYCPLSDQLMGRTAETLAERYEISRDEQDRFALESQHKAGAAIDEGAFADEIVPVQVKDETVSADEHPRPQTTLEKLGKLPPVFKKDGTVHAGNSSGITDGACALLLAPESLVNERGWEPLGWFLDCAIAGVDPAIMGIGPVPATRQLLERTQKNLDDFDLIELNEAFAAQVLACERDLGFDRAKLNVHGGAIALGHPIGCTGARIVVTLLHALKRRQASHGLATLCVSGGLGLAASFTRS
jgi:acetyl-CoA C-acetyltransferase